MALIGDYQHGPQLAAQAPAEDGAGDEATFGSHTALSAPHAPAVRRWMARRSAVLPGRPAPPPRPAGPSARRPTRRRGAWLSAAGLAGAAAALVALGAVIALALDGGSGGRAPASSPNPGALGFPPTGPPPSSFPPLSGSQPGIGVIQPTGDGNTGFVVHGAGWPPRSAVTLTLAGRSGVSVRLLADGAGSFNYTIDQGHLFYPGPIPAGRHEVVVTGDRRRITAVFQVHPPPAGAPSPAP
jgi:hypothetical protein